MSHYSSVYVVTDVGGIQVENGQAINAAFQDALIPAKVDYVNDNPTAFSKACSELNSVRVSPVD